jgi:putative nucleotidyltransferase with HDIG domain
MALGPGTVIVRPPGDWETPERSPALERFYRELMAVDQLPSAPEIAQKMLVTINRDDANLRDLSNLIVKDQSLAVRLLRMSNSAMFAVRSKVTSIPQAVTLLGFGRVRDLVLGLSVWGALDAKSPAGRRYRKALWTHAATVAAASKSLAAKAGVDQGEAFTAGLLHDVGKLVLGLRLGDSYWEMLDEASEHGESADAVEMAAFSCHHATVGGWLMQLWKLPPALVDGVALHHEPLTPDFGIDLPSVVAIANRLVDASDPTSATTRADVLDEIRAFAPGLLDTEHWQETYAGLTRERAAIAGIFEG